MLLFLLHRVVDSDSLCLQLQDLLTKHKVLVAEFLEQNYDSVSARTSTVLAAFMNTDIWAVLH